MNRLIKGQVAALFALLSALVITLAACGGGSSSTGGGSGGGGSTVAGTVSDGVASISPDGRDQPLFVALADMLVEPAHAAPVEGVSVQLTCDGYNQSRTTESDGRFRFEGVPSGSCTLDVMGEQIALDVGADDSSTEVPVGGGGTVLHVEIEIEGGTVSGEVEDDLSSDDDDSSGDGASEDDDSLDDVSEDDVSDDESVDDDDSEVN